jgi:signal transduction histidine kinase
MTERVGQRDAQMRALLANVSHDLKTPMTSITGYAQSLVDGTAAPDEVSRVGGVIREEADHVNRLLADLLYLGEIDAGDVVTRQEDVPLDALVARCARRIEPVVRERGLDFEVVVAEDVVLRDVDPEKVERALTNVLDNAAKFAPPGGRISVRGNVAGVAVRLEVRNSGSRIGEEDLPRVFDRFFRGDRARRSSEGSGLGLAIARQLTELHGGSLRAKNEPDGVSLTFEFPA